MATGDRDGGLEAHRGSSGIKPELFTVDQAQQQTVAIADTIEIMRTLGHRYSDQAVLCSGNEKLSNLAQELEGLGFLGSLFKRPEVKDALTLLSLLTDRRATGLVRISCWPEFAMSCLIESYHR
jgi:superfamily I DNA/RNA helicase